MNNDIEIWLEGFVKDDVLVPYDPKLDRQVRQHYNGQKIEYCIRIKKRKPSKEMHAFIRKVLYPLAKNAEVFGGWSENKIITHFKKEHFGTADKSLSDVSFEEMHGYIDYIVNVLASHDIQVPERPLTTPIL